VIAAPATGLDALFARAAALEERGALDAALCAYLDLLVRERDHLGAMLGAGRLFAAQHMPQAARAVFAEAASRDPCCATAFAGLGKASLELGDLATARRSFETAVVAAPQDRDAQLGLAIVLERAGDRTAAAAVWRRAFPDGQLATARYRGAGTPIRAVVICSALGGNAAFDRLLDAQTFEVSTLFAEGYRGRVPLPAGAVLVNAVADADLCGEALAVAGHVAAASGAVAVNRPERVRATGRVANAARLAALDDVVTPRTAAFSRDVLTGPGGLAALEAAGFAWPLLVRSTGFHNGEHFSMVRAPGRLSRTAASLPGDTLLAIEFVDVRCRAGLVRKYRAMAIDGALFPIHLAISRDWNVHYHNAANEEQPAFRDEERAFLDDMDGVLGPRASDALHRVAATLGLDYAGIDFALDADGDLVVFEANASMAIVPPKSDARWDYRRAAARRAADAVRAMVVERGGFPREG
jgi:hypothetical protein